MLLNYNKKIRVILYEDAKKQYENFNEKIKKQKIKGKNNSYEITLLKSLRNKIELIKTNPFYGNNIEKKKIPIKYSKYGNLWRVELSNYWRMLYTIKGNKIEIICIIIEIIDHNKYNKLFNYN